MAFFNYVANYFQSTYKYETKDTLLGKLFYLSPAKRAERLNELFNTEAFWGLETNKDNNNQIK
ncbi:hypothetical protein [Vibrio sp. 10N]|uniref:hypothetical protein n=1 Tax=Vibrio sp. 10N TaxID=3058938 RepID=UPI0028147F63|nr:hypothetical protein VB10N_39900 [Vibrio sp. 10N]